MYLKDGDGSSTEGNYLTVVQTVELFDFILFGLGQVVASYIFTSADLVTVNDGMTTEYFLRFVVCPQLGSHMKDLPVHTAKGIDSKGRFFVVDIFSMAQDLGLDMCICIYGMATMVQLHIMIKGHPVVIIEVHIAERTTNRISAQLPTAEESSIALPLGEMLLFLDDLSFPVHADKVGVQAGRVNDPQHKAFGV